MGTVCLRHSDLSEVVTTAAKNSNSAQLIVNLLVVVMLSRKQPQYLTCSYKYTQNHERFILILRFQVSRKNKPLLEKCVIVGAKYIISWAFHRHITSLGWERVVSRSTALYIVTTLPCRKNVAVNPNENQQVFFLLWSRERGAKQLMPKNRANKVTSFSGKISCRLPESSKTR